jgi:hypothetical protein
MKMIEILSSEINLEKFILTTLKKSCDTSLMPSPNPTLARPRKRPPAAITTPQPFITQPDDNTPRSF